jgi:ubiquinone biosynthesis accessory factor UbiK
MVERETMDTPKKFSDAQNQFSQLVGSLPAGAVQAKFRAVVDQLLDKYKLVTREELELQAQVLARTRERLEELEAQVALLEKES